MHPEILYQISKINRLNIMSSVLHAKFSVAFTASFKEFALGGIVDRLFPKTENNELNNRVIDIEKLSFIRPIQCFLRQRNSSQIHSVYHSCLYSVSLTVRNLSLCQSVQFLMTWVQSSSASLSSTWRYCDQVFVGLFVHKLMTLVVISQKEMKSLDTQQ